MLHRKRTMSVKAAVDFQLLLHSVLCCMLVNVYQYCTTESQVFYHKYCVCVCVCMLYSFFISLDTYQEHFPPCPVTIAVYVLSVLSSVLSLNVGQ